MNDPRPSELAAQIAALRANVALATESSTELKSLVAYTAGRARHAMNGRAMQFDALERALAAERRLESLIRLAASILPAQADPLRESYRPPSAWRALARELARARRHLARARGEL
jgi:hypothetical protein